MGDRLKEQAPRILCVCMVAVLLFCAVIFSGESSSANTPTAVAPMATESSASVIAMLNVHGQRYDMIKALDVKPALDREVAVVESGYTENDTRTIKKGEVYSTVLTKGTVVYSYGGFDPEFRVCGESQDQWWIFQRKFYDGIPDIPVNKLLDIKGRVQAIVLTDNESAEMGRIDDPAVVDKLIDNLLTQGSYTQNRYEFRDYHRRVKLLLNDGTEAEGPYKNGTTWLAAWIQLSETFAQALDELERHTAGVPLNAMGGGLTVGYDQANLLPGLLIDTADHSVLYTCWWGWMGEWLPVDPGPVRDVQMAGDSIWFIAGDGTIRRIICTLKDPENNGYNSYNQFGELMQTHGALSDYLKAGEPIAGDFQHLRVLQGSIVTLDRTGVLAMDGKPLAHGVRLMDIDNDAVIYADAKAVYRYESGSSSKLLEGSFTAICSFGHSILVSDAGGIRRMPYAGGESRLLSPRKADKLLYDGAGGTWLIEQETQALYFIDTYGKEQLIRPQGVLDVGLVSNGIVVTSEKKPDGTTTMYRISMPQPGGDVLSRESLLAMQSK